MGLAGVAAPPLAAPSGMRGVGGSGCSGPAGAAAPPVAAAAVGDAASRAAGTTACGGPFACGVPGGVGKLAFLEGLSAGGGVAAPRLAMAVCWLRSC